MDEVGKERSIDSAARRVQAMAETIGASTDRGLRPLSEEMFAASPVRKSLYRELRAIEKQVGQSAQPVPPEQRTRFTSSLDAFIKEDPANARMVEYLPTYLFPSPADGALHIMALDVLRNMRSARHCPDALLYDLRDRGALTDEEVAEFLPKVVESQPSIKDRIIPKMFRRRSQAPVNATAAPARREFATSIDSADTALHRSSGMAEHKHADTVAEHVKTIKHITEAIMHLTTS